MIKEDATVPNNISGNSLIFRLRKYEKTEYILLPCSLRKTAFSSGKVRITGLIDAKKPATPRKNSAPFFE